VTERIEPMDDLHSLRAGIVRFGPYRVVEQLAGGGMAEIYLVRAPSERLFALKLIRADRSDDAEFREMLVDEAKIASRLAHPNIARVIEIAEHDGQVGLILEFVDGIDLIRAQRVLRERGVPLSIEAAVALWIGVLEGLDFAHNVRDEAGALLHVVHRDVSPGNIMIDVDGRPRLVDWGIARAKNRAAHTDAGHVKGKFRYMAPEQISGLAVGPAADLYSSAMTFWELLANARIYDEVELPQLMLKVSKADVPDLDRARAGVPRGLLASWRAATHRDPERRPRSCLALADDLRGLGILRDGDRVREELAGIAIAARVSDGKRGYEKAVRRVKSLASADLEGALLRALESPDRVERVDTGENGLLDADALGARTRMSRPLRPA